MQLEFQYQYQPEDLLAIREAVNEVVFSPASKITATAVGIAGYTIVLGALGAWNTLFVVLIASMFGLYLLVRRLNQNRHVNQEYQFRNLQLMDQGIVESTPVVERRKSWSAFQELVETDAQFLLNHYQQVTVLPKRILPPGRIDSYRNFLQKQIGRQIGTGRKPPLPEFAHWIQSTDQVFKFRWTESDRRDVQNASLRVFEDCSDKPDLGISLAAVLLVCVFLISWATSLSLDGMVDWTWNQPHGWTHWQRLVLCVAALLLPLSTYWLFRAYTFHRAGESNFQWPDDEISLGQTQDCLIVGCENAVAKYDISCIKTLYLSHKTGRFSDDYRAHSCDIDQGFWWTASRHRVSATGSRPRWFGLNRGPTSRQPANQEIHINPPFQVKQPSYRIFGGLNLPLRYFSGLLFFAIGAKAQLEGGRSGHPRDAGRP